MELTKSNILDDSDMCLKPMFSYYENDDFGGSPPSLQGYDQSSPQKSNKIFQGSNSPSPSQVKNVGVSHSSSSSPSSSNSSGLVCNPTLKYHQADEGNSIFGFKAGCGNSLNAHTSGSLLSFGQDEQFHQTSFSRMNNQEDFSIWKDNMHHSNLPLKDGDGVQFGWMNMGSNTSPNSTGMADLGREEVCLIKRACEEESVQPPKKQCISPTKQVKTNVSSSSKDPQSLAAKNRRERISERLKSLQELVPNGTKVDLVTMLEKAITYVKFLQLQVKILATDEFWPVQGGKAPKLSQVQDAIDTILTAQREGKSSSK